MCVKGTVNVISNDTPVSRHLPHLPLKDFSDQVWIRCSFFFILYFICGFLLKMSCAFPACKWATEISQKYDVIFYSFDQIKVFRLISVLYREHFFWRREPLLITLTPPLIVIKCHLWLLSNAKSQEKINIYLY